MLANESYSSVRAITHSQYAYRFERVPSVGRQCVPPPILPSLLFPIPPTSKKVEIFQVSMLLPVHLAGY